MSVPVNTRPPVTASGVTEEIRGAYGDTNETRRRDIDISPVGNRGATSGEFCWESAMHQANAMAVVHARRERRPRSGGRYRWLIRLFASAAGIPKFDAQSSDFDSAFNDGSESSFRM